LKKAGDATMTLEEHPRKLVEHNGGKTIVVYAFHEYNRNVKFFLNFGVTEDPNVDYMIVQNMPEWPKDQKSELENSEIGTSKMYWIRRPNISTDIGAYSEAMRNLPEDTYDYFVFVNSTVRGPFLPVWYNKKEHWSSCFTRLLSDTVAIVGLSIVTKHIWYFKPYVQSMAYAIDARGVELYRHHGIFMSKNKGTSKLQRMVKYEQRGSRVLLKYGYNLDCFLTAAQGRDWQSRKNSKVGNNKRLKDVWHNRGYLGYNVHPHESLFFKTNRRYNFKHTIHDEMTYWIEEQNEGSLHEGIRKMLQDTDYNDDDDVQNISEDVKDNIASESPSTTLWFVITGILLTLMIVFGALWVTQMLSK
jgi:hypothetical protein